MGTPIENKSLGEQWHKGNTIFCVETRSCKLRLELFVWLGLYQVSGRVPLPVESTELNKGNFWNCLLEYWDKCYCFYGESHDFFEVW